MDAVLKYFSRSGLLPVIYIMAVIILISLIIVCIIALFDRKEGNRERFVKSIIILLIAGFLITCSVTITKLVYSSIENQTISDTTSSSSETSQIEPLERDVGWGENLLYDILNLFADTAVWARNFLIGEDLGLRQTLSKTANNTIISFNVSYDGGKSINLYNLILTSSSFLLFFMVINTIYKLTKYSYNPNMRDEVINSFKKWAYTVLLMMLVPYIFIALLKIMETMMNILNKINTDSILTTDSLTVEQYGPLAPVAKIYSAYLEFKVYVLMLYRKFIINVFFVTLPIVIYLYGISDNFESFTTWINTLLINIFSPLFYSLVFVIATLVLKSIPNGDNPITIIIVLSISLGIADVVKKIVKLKSGGQILGSSSEVNSISKVIFSTAMAVKTVQSILSKKAINNTSSVMESKNNELNNIASQNQYVNTNNGLRANYSTSEKIKDSINTLGSSKTAKVIAGIATGITTGNPMLGYVAYKGAGALLSGISKGANISIDAYKRVDKTVDKIEDKFKKYNTDHKAYRRD